MANFSGPYFAMEVTPYSTQLQRAAQTQEALRNNEGQGLAFQDSLIARAASHVDPNSPSAADDWDAAMRQAQAEGAPSASQFIGKYNPALHQRVVGAYSAPNPLAAASAMQTAPGAGLMAAAAQGGGAGGGAGLGASVAGAPVGMAGMTPEQYGMALQSMTPQQMQDATTKASAALAAIQRVATSANPSQAWDQEAQQLGHPEWVGRYSPQGLQQMYQHFNGFLQYADQMQLGQSLGIPRAGPEAKVMSTQEGIYSAQPTLSGIPNVQQIAGPKSKWQYIGTDKDGQPIVQDANTGDVKTITGADVANPRWGPHGAAGGHSVWQAKHDAWIQLHPGDDSGAMAFASGQKRMNPEQMLQAAQKTAAADLNAISLSGNPPPDPQGWLKQREQELVGQYQSAGQEAPPNPAGTPARPTRMQGNGRYPMPSASAVAYLRQTHDWRNFDAKYGSGAAAKVLEPKQYGALQ